MATYTMADHLAYPSDRPQLPGLTLEMQAAIRRTAASLGIDPVDLAMAMYFETKGTFNPWIAGPVTAANGQQTGLIQWGVPQQQEFGVTGGMLISDQLLAVDKYLRENGIDPGDGILNIYSAILAGEDGPQYYDRVEPDVPANQPNTAREHVEVQIEPTRAAIEAALLTAAEIEERRIGEAAGNPFSEEEIWRRQTYLLEGGWATGQSDGVWSEAWDAAEQRRWSDEVVRPLQESLQFAGYYPGPIDGAWGRGTTRAFVDRNVTQQVDSSRFAPYNVSPNIGAGTFHRPVLPTWTTAVTPGTVTVIDPTIAADANVPAIMFDPRFGAAMDPGGVLPSAANSPLVAPPTALPGRFVDGRPFTTGYQPLGVVSGTTVAAPTFQFGATPPPQWRPAVYEVAPTPRWRPLTF